MAFDFLLNRDALRAADDRFFAAHPELVREDGTRSSRNRALRSRAALKHEWWGYYREEKTRLRAPAAAEAQEEADPVAVTAPCPYAAPAPQCTPIASVELTSVRYVNAFLLYEEEEKWTCFPATPYHPVQWTPERSCPIVVHFDDRFAFSAEITYRVEGADACPETAFIQSLRLPAPPEGRTLAHVPEDQLDGRPPKEVELTPGDGPTLAYKGIQYPPQAIGVMEDHGSEWQANAARRTFAMGFPRNKVYLTWGPAKGGLHPEDGPTTKRMEAAISMAFGANSVDEFEVVAHMFGLFPRYTLGVEHLPGVLRDKLLAEPETLKAMQAQDWPTYFEQNQPAKAGAWPFLDAEVYGAECQAICRLIRGAMRQLGARSQIEFRTYTADFKDPTKPLNQGAPTGPNPDRFYLLADQPVKIGETYPHTGQVGFNNFEAFLKVTSPGMDRPRLLGGGVGLLEEGRNPLAVFCAMVECEWVEVTLPSEKPDGPERKEWRYRVADMFDYKKEGVFKDWDGVLP